MSRDDYARAVLQQRLQHCLRATATARGGGARVCACSLTHSSGAQCAGRAAELGVRTDGYARM
eukprot:3183814-Pleurochrysis_carterae.AAC.1